MGARPHSWIFCFCFLRFSGLGLGGYGIGEGVSHRAMARPVPLFVCCRVQAARVCKAFYVEGGGEGLTLPLSSSHSSTHSCEDALLHTVRTGSCPLM